MRTSPAWRSKSRQATQQFEPNSNFVARSFWHQGVFGRCGRLQRHPGACKTHISPYKSVLRSRCVNSGTPELGTRVMPASPGRTPQKQKLSHNSAPYATSSPAAASGNSGQTACALDLQARGGRPAPGSHRPPPPPRKWPWAASRAHRSDFELPSAQNTTCVHTGERLCCCCVVKKALG